MKAIVFALTALSASLAFAAGDLSNPIDLGRPGALERLKAEAPLRYAAVSEILRVAEHTPCKSGELEVLKARYDVRDWQCTFLVMTSYPAKRRVTFALEGTKYVATVTLQDADGKIMPALEPPR
jgi:hypothetical protein